MFSVPLSIAISAPEDTANHSTGTCIRSARSSAAMIRRHSGSARLPSPRVGSPSSATRVMPSGTFVGVVREQPDDEVRGVEPRFAVDRHEHAVGLEVVLDEAAGREVRPTCPGGGANIRTISYG